MHEYEQGFIHKCASAGVDPEVLVKLAQKYYLPKAMHYGVNTGFKSLALANAGNPSSHYWSPHNLSQRLGTGYDTTELAHMGHKAAPAVGNVARGAASKLAPHAARYTPTAARSLMSKASPWVKHLASKGNRAAEFAGRMSPYLYAAQVGTQGYNQMMFDPVTGEYDLGKALTGENQRANAEIASRQLQEQGGPTRQGQLGAGLLGGLSNTVSTINAGAHRLYDVGTAQQGAQSGQQMADQTQAWQQYRSGQGARPDSSNLTVDMPIWAQKGKDIPMTALNRMPEYAAAAAQTGQDILTATPAATVKMPILDPGWEDQAAMPADDPEMIRARQAVQAKYQKMAPKLPSSYTAPIAKGQTRQQLEAQKKQVAQQGKSWFNF